MFDVEKNVPLPTSTRGRYQFPLTAMDIGDSFLVPLDDANEKSISSIRQSLHNAKKRTGMSMKLVTSVTPDGLRVWRTE